MISYKSLNHAELHHIALHVNEQFTETGTGYFPI